MITETFTIKEMEAEISKNYSAIMGALLKYAPQYKKAKEDYYINKLMSLETGSLMKDATVWFDNKSMPLDKFKAKCLGQILLTGPYKVYIKRTGTQVDKLNTCLLLHIP